VSFLRVHAGRAFPRPTNGTCATRSKAARELRECYAAFRQFLWLSPRECGWR
jgi:hypothetical protein